ncbi:MAG: 3-phosphoshikimate 1-carboxyvinyltransferase [Syntrophobacteria bacterium]
MKQIRTVEHLDTTVSIPGSKSITHRYLIMAALAAGRSRITNALWCADTRYTAAALEKLGARINHSPEAVEVIGTGGELLCPSEPIYLDNAGTAMRLLTAVVCLGRGSYVLAGDERMHRRPIGELLAGLRPLGGEAESVEQNDCPPVRVRASRLKGGRTELDASRSSQFVSAILLAAPYAARAVEVTLRGLVSRPYVDITLEGMAAFGARGRWVDEKTLRVEAPDRYLAGTHNVEGDCSSASYFWAAAAITAGRVRTSNIRSGSRQGDLRLLQLLRQMGCGVQWDEEGVTVTGAPLRGITVDMSDMPDMVPTLAVIAAFARGTTRIGNVGHLRLKESDRLRAVAEGLQRMNLRVEEGSDSLTITGGKAQAASIDPHNDHRIAMSFAVSGLRIGGVCIEEASCVEKSFPQFWELFQQLYS